MALREPRAPAGAVRGPVAQLGLGLQGSIHKAQLLTMPPARAYRAYPPTEGIKSQIAHLRRVKRGLDCDLGWGRETGHGWSVLINYALYTACPY